MANYSFEQDDNKLRPRSFDDYVGQEKIKNNLKVFIKSALNRGEPLDHILLYGPPGLGKTTLANIIANEMGTNIKITSGPAIEKVVDLASILSNLEDGDILFIDEIHRLNRPCEEMLYPAMEDFAIDFIVGQGATARSVRMPINKFTLVGATTRAGMMSAPLRDRFGFSCRLELYNPFELSKIIERSAGLLGMNITETASYEIAVRSRGTPRIANNFLKRVRDFAEYEGSKVIGSEHADKALDALEVDHLGLDSTDRRIVLSIIEQFKGGPVGLETLSAATGEDISTIEDYHEPYLMQIGFISRTGRGRVALAPAYKHFGKPVPDYLNDDENK